MSKTATPKSNRSPYTLPMQTAGIHHLVERVYREGAPYQWVRETVVNALEAGATRVELTTEFQAVEKLGVHRRLIIDNGKGMTPDELVSFFNTFGHGGKSIGGLHENFGVGSKTSLLPWNKYGLVVVSWQGDSMAMIWARCDASTGEYGLRLMEAVDDAGWTAHLHHCGLGRVFVMENTHTVYVRVEEDDPGSPQDAWCNLCEESCDAVVEVEDGRYACEGCLQERIDALQEALQTKESAAQARREKRIREVHEAYTDDPVLGRFKNRPSGSRR